METEDGEGRTKRGSWGHYWEIEKWKVEEKRREMENIENEKEDEKELTKRKWTYRSFHYDLTRCVPLVGNVDFPILRDCQ